MEEMDLAALMAELQSVQKAPSVFKLSEPNVVEVMQKLAELGLVDVLFTSNGKEYLTPKQLRNEVEDEILAHGGRINTTELAPILNVDLPFVERAVDEVLKKDPSLQLFHGEVISFYLSLPLFPHPCILRFRVRPSQASSSHCWPSSLPCIDTKLVRI